jgi:hypothetical protein
MCFIVCRCMSVYTNVLSYIHTYIHRAPHKQSCTVGGQFPTCIIMYVDVCLCIQMCFIMCVDVCLCIQIFSLVVYYSVCVDVCLCIQIFYHTYIHTYTERLTSNHALSRASSRMNIFPGGKSCRLFDQSLHMSLPGSMYTPERPARLSKSRCHTACTVCMYVCIGYK